MLGTGKNRKILIFAAHYLPGYKAGGPIRSLKGLLDLLNEDYRIKVITLNRDFGEREAYTQVNTNQWNKIHNVDIFYGSDDFFSLKNIKNIILDIEPDYIYINSFFDKVFSIRLYILLTFMIKNRVQLVIAPRGEFSSGALGIKKFKKYYFIKIFKYFLNSLSPIWHASSDIEKKIIQEIFPIIDPQKIHVAINCPDFEQSNNLQDFNYINVNNNVLKICFLGRISRMKNLKFALEVLSNIEHEIEFTIYGPCEDPIYWDECHQLIINMRKNIKISVAGPIEHSRVQAELSRHDVFFLPTLGENFGHVIIEALAAGLILLISDQTIWKNLTDDGVGWEIALKDRTLFESSINELATLPRRELIEFRGRCQQKSADWFNEQDFKNNYSEIFKANSDRQIN